MSAALLGVVRANLNSSKFRAPKMGAAGVDGHPPIAGTRKGPAEWAEALVGGPPGNAANGAPSFDPRYPFGKSQTTESR